MTRIAVLTIATLAMLAPVAAASTGSGEAAQGQEGLKVTVVVSRYQGEKKISSMPYTMSVVSGENRGTSLRMGVNVPVPSKEGAGYTFQTVGTNIDCHVIPIAGQYRLQMTVNDTAVFAEPAQPAPGTPRSMMGNVPALRTFTSSFSLLMRDGQTTQHTTATDPISGEVLKLDVTLNVLK